MQLLRLFVVLNINLPEHTPFYSICNLNAQNVIMCKKT